MMLSDDILGRENHWEKLYSPARIKASLGAAKTVMDQGVSVTRHIIGDRIMKPKGSLRDLGPGEGGLFVATGKEIAAYKGVDGKLYLLSPVCRHMGCIVGWNSAEKTWDCPCHGSRYRYDGKVIHGPALSDLIKIDPKTVE
jgi:Rieske Fe-S protein